MTHFFQGVYPLWDPGYFNGFPFEFFLRRIGDGNPFYLLVAFAKSFGASNIHAYQFFLTFYYFLAVTGFWLICRHVLRHRLAYTGAYLILLFSGWGARVFSDYILLIFVPLIWFFYFSITFFKEGKRHQFLGLLLAAAIAMTTYIPFFFLTVVGTIAFSGLIFFPKNIISAVLTGFSFIKTNRIFVTFGCLFFLLAISPEIQFFNESQRGEFIMPGRNVGTAEKSTLAVGIAHVKVGDLMSQGHFDKVFENHTRLSLIDFFVPYFFFLILILSVINPVTRKTIFLAVNTIFLGILCVTDTSRIYAFLYQYIFIFKYMRMMSFFFWTSVFPLGILLAMHQLDVFLDTYRGKKNVFLLVFVISAHLLFGAWTLTQTGITWLSWVAIASSLTFFLGIISGWRDSRILLGLLCMIITLQPMGMISYIAKNEAAARGDIIPQSHLSSDKKFKFENTGLSPEELNTQTSSLPEGGIYCGTKWYQDLSVNIPYKTKVAFTANTLYLMDQTYLYDDTTPEFFLRLKQKWDQRLNLVFLSNDKALPEDIRSSNENNPPEIIKETSQSVKVLHFTPNTLELKTTLDRSRFLLWVDNYHSAWHVFINGKEKPLLRADHAFKGVWIPPGENRILFQFEKPITYLWRYLVWFSFLLALAAVVFLAIRENAETGKQKALS